MKLSILRMFATLSLGAALGPACLRAQRLQVEIPFDFTVGSKYFSAGGYMVRNDAAPSVVTIQSADFRSVAAAITNAVVDRKATGAPKLVFKRYGDRYFLSEVWPRGSMSGRQMLPSPAEKELIAKAAAPKTVALAASAK